jgi:anionic cell wall polymer biosynthesis LytR-Cps2A-Psr (LCP) family protein
VDGKLYSAYALGLSQNDQFLRPEWQTPTGAGDLAAATVSEAIGQPVDYWVAIDTGAFAAIIDDLGGVAVTVPVPLDDPAYPVHFDAGPQVLDGARALKYAQSRLSTSELDRSRRQELVLVGLMQRLRDPQIGVGVLWSLGPLESGMRTNVRPVEMRDLARLVTALHQKDVRRITLDDSGLLESTALGGGEIITPVNGDYGPVRDFIAGQLP